MLVELGEASVAGLGGVRRLDLSYNKLSSVPQLASLGPSLQQLSVSGNMVKQLTQDSLHGLTSLQVSPPCISDEPQPQHHQQNMKQTAILDNINTSSPTGFMTNKHCSIF